MKKRTRIGILVAVMCMLFGSMTVFAQTGDFRFVIKKGGSGRIWAAVYDRNGGSQYTSDVGIRPGETYRHSTGYYKTGVAGTTYSIRGNDSEWEITSDAFDVIGKWTP